MTKDKRKPHKNAIVLIILTALMLSNLIIFPVSQQVQALGRLMEENEVEGSGDGLSVYEGYYVAQSFIASSNYTFTKVGVYAKDEGSTDGELTIQIWNNDDQGDGNPDNDVPLFPFTGPRSINGPNEFEWLYFWILINLVEGEKYWIVANTSYPENDGYKWKDSEEDAYPNGNIATGGNPDWLNDTSNDLMFRVFGIMNIDVGVEEIIAPGRQELNMEANVTAVVMNYGSESQSDIDVRCIIEDPSGTEIINDTKSISYALNYHDVAFLSWFFTPAAEGVYSINITTLLAGDQNNSNNASSMNMEVESSPVLKLHDNIIVDGNLDDWNGEELSTGDTWLTSKREYVWKDAVGDDDGDGDYEYPTDDRFEEGCLDITEFRVCIDQDRINFMIKFGSIDYDGTDSPLEFSEQIIEILIDVDRDATGRDDTLRNARLRLDQSIGWEYAVWVDGWENGYLENVNGERFRDIYAFGSPVSDAVEVSVILPHLVAPDFETWRYVVLVGAQDGYSLPESMEGSQSGFMRVDEVADTNCGGGGYDKNGADSNVYDILFASPQDAQLNNYDNEDMELALFFDVLGESGDMVDEDESWAQSFTAPFTCLLSSVEVYAKDVGADSDEMEIKIHTNELGGDVPSSVKISSPEYTDFSADDYEWKSVEFSNPAVIRVGEIYWIVARSNDTQGEGYLWGSRAGNPFPDGVSARKIGNSPWFAENNTDMQFAVMGRRLTTVDMSQPVYFAPMVIDEVFSNGSADYEWINITYDGTILAPDDLDMNNWTLTDQDGNTFQFRDFQLDRKKTVCVHSGVGVNGTFDLYWGRTQEVWNDFGDDVLLNSSFIIPVDYMNYTDGNVFGDPPPIGSVWEPDENENLPRSPHALQKLRLRSHAIDNDLYRDWDLLALGDVKGKTLYLFDDGTLDKLDPTDYMNTTFPRKMNVVDFDDDDKPGLTLKKSDPSTDPEKYQEFDLTPVLAKDLSIVDDVMIHLWVDTENSSKKEIIVVTLFDRNATSDIEIANQSTIFTTDDQKGWELVIIVIPDVDYTLERKHNLTLHIRVDSTSDEDLYLGYNSTKAPSCIKTIPTRTYVNIDWAKTYGIYEIEKTIFLIDEDVIIKANISDPFGSYDIIGANITIRRPSASGDGPENAMIVESIDSDDPSAWKLFNYTYTNTNKIGKYTVKIKGIESNGVIHTITIYFTIRGNTEPVLFGPSHLPNKGSASTSFNFSIRYSDADNNPPDIVTLNITGRGIFEMIALDPGDSDYTDGNVYYINLTGFVNGTEYTYHFAANDSKGLWNETEEFSGPFVLNTPPSLSIPGLFPGSGNATTSFNFTVNYTDIDNQLPDVITVNITGPSHSGSWSMIQFDQDDTNCTDGKWYYYIDTGFVNGSYSYHFAASDSQGAWVNTSEYSGPHVINTPPTLIDEEVIDLIGYITTEFNYTVTYIDLDNQAPGVITVNISGPSHAGSWSMIEYDQLDTNYIDGKEYYYTYTGLEMGSYSFHCAAKDTQDSWSESQNISFPIVLNSRPTLSNHNLNPTVGETGVTDFNYTVTYTDLDNHTCGKITVNITGPYSGNFTMIEYDPFDTNYTDGKVYYYNRTLPLDGNYSYRIDANDTYELWAIPIMDSGPNVGIDAPPVLTEPRVNPETGNTAIEYNFTVNFTDLQNDSADVILLNLSGPSGGLFVMFEVDPSDENTTDGKYFYCLLSGLEKGYYSFYVKGNDTKGNSTKSVLAEFPVVQNSLPQLFGSYINESEYGESWFNFTLTYLDIDDDSPGSVNVLINGIGNFTMNELDPTDVSYDDGKEYYYNITISKGSYSYRFESVDSGFEANWNYTSFKWIHLINNLPTVIIQQVTPPSGFGGDFFNFTINVLDSDNEILEVLLYIQGEAGSPFEMNELDILDTDTNDGKIYYYNITFVKGSYDYNYSFYDGDESNQTTPLTLIVKNNPPIIITSDMTSVDEDSPYSVDYNNTDLDGDSITWSLETNGTWLNIDPNTGILGGTPTNSEVGSYYVNVTVDDGDGGIGYRNFTLNVINTLPLLTTVPDEFAKEDILHLNDFNCIDDGQGNIIYSIETNASWLNIESVLGILSGTPDNTDVGWYWVNVSVNDGNGGIVSLNYSLTVNNTLPSITTIPVQEAQEDVQHLEDFSCNDDSQGKIRWSLGTNATWLSITSASGILSGTPVNDQVGWFWVNITVSDGNGGIDFVYYTLTVVNTPPRITTTPETTAFEDSPHSDDFNCDDDNQGNIVYSLTSNATWLSLNPITGILTGTPNNLHVGVYFVNVTVSDGNGGFDSVNYSLTVINVPPSITNTPNTWAIEDILHSDDFNCIDDGQGNIVYSLLTNATWLNLNQITGLLSGTPDNSFVGWYWVNVSVVDGNGGMDFRNYILTVADVNDPPVIITPNLEFSSEDFPYFVDYNFTDVDDKSVIWRLIANASWLYINPLTGELSGTPENDDVGWYWVNVSADDERGGLAFSNFTLMVNNTPPSITNIPIPFVNEDDLHLDYFSCDDDDQGNITYSLATNASWLAINPDTGLLYETPDNTDVGWYWVKVTVNDGNGGLDSINFTLTVLNVPPTISTTPNNTSTEDMPHLDDFNCDDDNQGSIIYSFQTNASWLNFNNLTGHVSGTPDNDDVGSYWVNITVDDGNGGLDFENYTLEVLNTNDPPIITTGHIEFINEDSFYFVDYESSDVDFGDEISWSLITNASWLSINEDTGILSGRPANAHVGWFYVNVNASDEQGGYDLVNFIIVVNNTNDAPLRPQLIWPADDSAINTTAPTFTWNPAIDPDRGDYIVDYTLQSSTSADFTENLTTITDIIDTSYTPESRFEDEKTYYWRVEAHDSFGVSSGFQTVLFVFYIDTGYEPPAYNQKLKSAIIMPGEDWSVNLDDYFDLGSVTEGLIFTTNYPEIEIDQETHMASWSPASESDNLTDVIFRVFDGTTIVSSGPIDLSVETVTIEKEQLTIWERIYWPWSLFLMIFLIILLGAILVKRYKTRPIVEEVFFVYEDGRLIAHASTRTEEDIDEDILSSMLTGVKDFVSDAFIRDKAERDEKGLNKLEFGEKSILLERGNHYFIALISTGRDSFPKLKGVMEDIEERYGSVLGDWDGEMRVFKGSDEIISRLLPLEKLSEEEKEKIKDARKKEKVIEKWESVEEETSGEPQSMEELRKEMGWK